MELKKVMEQRQSIRRYEDGNVSEAALAEIIQSAAYAPSAKNLQNWHFIAVTNREVIRQIGDIVLAKNEKIAAEMDKVDEEKANRFRKFCRNFTVFWQDTAPALILVMASDYLPDGYKEYQLIGGEQAILDDLKLRRNPGMQSIGCALENLTLKAVEKGFGTTILTSPNYAAPEIEAFLKEQAIFNKEDHYLVSMMSVGIPQKDQKSPPKKALEEFFTLVR